MSQKKIRLQFDFEVDEDYFAQDCDSSEAEFGGTMSAALDDFVDWLNGDYAGDVGDDEPKEYVKLTSWNVIKECSETTTKT